MIVLLLVPLGMILLFLIYLFVLLRPSALPRNAGPALFCHYAHRGLHGDAIPENSLAAFRAAADAGYGIELDIQRSSDGEVMVFHDDTLDRMTDVCGKLNEKTAAELGALHLKTADGQPSDQTIPTLQEVLQTVDGRVPLLIELKGESTDTALCPVADAILRGYHGAFCVESFNPMLLYWYRKHNPSVLRGQLYTDVCREKGRSVLHALLTCMALNVLSRPHFIAYDRKYRHKLAVILTTRFFSAKHFVWTVRKSSQMPDDGTPTIFEFIRP